MVDLNPLKSLTNDLALDLRDSSSALIRMSVLQKILDNMDEYAAIIDKDYKLVTMNKKFECYLTDHKLFVARGDNWYKSIYNMDTIPDWDPIKDAMEKRTVVIRKFVSPATGNTFEAIVVPLLYNGVSGVFTVSKIIGEVK